MFKQVAGKYGQFHRSTASSALRGCRELSTKGIEGVENSQLPLSTEGRLGLTTQQDLFNATDTQPAYIHQDSKYVIPLKTCRGTSQRSRHRTRALQVTLDSGRSTIPVVRQHQAAGC
jgi:hypothetical protein